MHGKKREMLPKLQGVVEENGFSFWISQNGVGDTVF